MTLATTKDVLIVDDDAAIRTLVATALMRMGVTCDTAEDGAEALERVAAARYLVIVVDLMMPRVDGGSFVTALREREQSSLERPVVLMMTAFPVRERGPDLGDKVQAVIQKPFDVVELAELVHDCVEARRASRSRDAVRTTADEGTPLDLAADLKSPTVGRRTTPEQA